MDQRLGASGDHYYKKNVQVELNGEEWTSGTPITEKGDYALSVQAVDQAGHAAEQTIPFKLYHSTVLAASDAVVKVN
ncbi:hypothetical protein BC351_28210 [Paenibacillus ferrarius]|uniref:Bacterial Ig-like domain-containing protein n=1 Tax=Paenibacillus ferrarius TaxID=1469647 RepID=A0A1V4HHW2_9BACL|nr:hypothetical protein [Paenibacillus ferrarius]OPH56380.1 hypothetical protein BC351_28210 [Paenibacillus ferrarius]